MGPPFYDRIPGREKLHKGEAGGDLAIDKRIHFAFDQMPPGDREVVLEHGSNL
jgi:hypothetical protein